MENLVRSPRGSSEIKEMARNAGREIDGFVKRRWVESVWEAAWFVDPPVSDDRAFGYAVSDAEHSQRLQSVCGLAHIHVFTKKH
jgi:hypothetical protein